MRSYKRWAVCAVLVGLSIVLTTSQAADDDKAIRDKVDELAGIAAKTPDELQKKAEAWVKAAKPDLDDVMGLLKKRTKDGGGFGVGKIPTGKADDGIEARIEKLAREGAGKDGIKDKADVIQALNRAKAIAAIAQVSGAGKKMGGKQWQEYADRMVKGTDDLAKAIESGNTKDIKKAANNLHSSCTDCHADFR